MRLGQADVPDYIACVVRQAVAEIGGFDWTTMGIVSAESNFDPRALGDGGLSFGLLQLYTAGGQGSDYAGHGEDLFDPKLNLAVGQPYIARAVLYATQQGWQGERFIREVARRSGHPGFVPLDDYRLTNIYQHTVRLITRSDGSLAAWPPHNPAICSGVPAPPPPLGSWAEGPAPATAQQADDYIRKHLERIGELVDRF